MAQCPDEKTILGFLGGSLSWEDSQDFEHHLDACDTCQQLVAALGKIQAVRENPNTSSTSGTGATLEDDDTLELAPSLAPGKRVERYRILECLGTGGMGNVYAALDPELNRKVALKFIRAELFPPDQRQRMLLRLKREAQALAQVSHSNVVTIYDVGIWQEQLFLVMEFVDGCTLYEWISKQRRSVSEILDVLRQSGQGLAATHKAGLVHRDFKPNNVLISNQGLAKVTDFGLVSTLVGNEGPKPGSDEPISETVPTQELSPEVLRQRITPMVFLSHEGIVVGTPAYMAPEQILGKAASAQSDQFSFCVTWYEALCGERPFAGEDLLTLKQEILAGRVKKTANKKVPSRIRRALQKGLRAEAQARHPSMESLLAAVTLPPHRFRRWIVVATVLALLAIVALALFFWWSSPCRGAMDLWLGIWDDTRRETIHKAFVSVDKPFANDAWKLVAQTLDTYTQQWAAIHQDACEATHVRKAQSDEMLDLRMECLGQRREEVKQLTDLMIKADAALVEHSAAAVGTLSDLRDCQDSQRLSIQVRPPKDPTQRAEVKRIREQLAKVKALLDAGKYPDGLALANDLVKAAQNTSYPPIEAETMYWQGMFEYLSGNEKQATLTLTEAMNRALAARHPQVVAHATIQLVYMVGIARSQFEEGLKLSQTARAALAAIGEDNALEGKLSHYLGTIQYNQGLYDDALLSLQRAQAFFEKAYGPDDPKLIPTLNSLAKALVETGNAQAALDASQRALGLAKKTLGIEHPSTALAFHSLGFIQAKVGDYPQALLNLRAALAIEKNTRPSHSNVGRHYWTIGQVLLPMGQVEEALSNLKSAQDVFEKTLGSEHPNLASLRVDIATAHRRLGSCDGAWTEIQQAMGILKRHLNPGNPRFALAFTEAGAVLCCLGRYQEAINLLMQAKVILENITHAQPDEMINTLGTLAEAQLELGNTTQALQLYQDALAFAEKHKTASALDSSRPVAGMAQLFYQQRNFKKSLSFYQRALDMIEVTFQEVHPEIADYLTGIGKSQLELGKAKQAISFLERALELRESYQANPTEMAETKFALAKALWDGSEKQNRSRARELAEAAQNNFRQAQGPHQKELAKVKTWLAAHLLNVKKYGGKPGNLRE